MCCVIQTEPKQQVQCTSNTESDVKLARWPARAPLEAGAGRGGTSGRCESGVEDWASVASPPPTPPVITMHTSWTPLTLSSSHIVIMHDMYNVHSHFFSQFYVLYCALLHHRYIAEDPRSPRFKSLSR